MEDDLKFAIQESSEKAPVEKVKMFINKYKLDFEPMIRPSEDPDIIRLYWRVEKLERVLTIYFKPNSINFFYVENFANIFHNHFFLSTLSCLGYSRLLRCSSSL